MTLADWAAAYCGATTAIHLATVTVAAIRCRPRPSQPDSSAVDAAGVTVLRPVCGVEPFSAETLGASFRLDFPTHELIFCVARADDPIVPVVRRLIRDNARTDARLLIGDDRVSANPKLNNVVKGWKAARYRWIVMADSNVVLEPDALRRLLAGWRADTGAVCSMPVGTRPANFWAELECAFLNTLQTRFQYVSEAFGFGFAQGKTMLFRRDIIEQAGGIGSLAADTAEDAATTKLVRAAGRRVRLVDRPFEQPLGHRSAAEVWSRQVRWARLRRASFPLLFLPELLLGSLFPCLAAAIAAAHYGLGVFSTALLLLTLWYGAEGVLALVARWRFSPRMLLAQIIRDLMLPALWIVAWWGTSFVWRGNAMRAERHGEAV